MRLLVMFFFSLMLALPVVAQQASPVTSVPAIAATASPIIIPIPTPNPGEQIVAPTPVEWQNFIQAIGNAKGGGVLVTILLLVQGLMMLLNGFLGQFAGKWRFFAMSGLTVVATIIGQVYYAGVSWPVALLSAPALAALQVWVHQGYKQFVVKKDEKPA